MVIGPLNRTSRFSAQQDRTHPAKNSTSSESLGLRRGQGQETSRPLLRARHARCWGARCGHWGVSTTMAVILGLMWALTTGCEPDNASVHAEADALSNTQRVIIGKQVFDLELALDHPSRFQGLSDRKTIDPDGGMLFVFPNAAVRAFVMRRCLVPIDILFLGPGGRVVAMHEMQVQPYDTPEGQLRRYSSRWPAQFVIELKGGTVRSLGLKLGDKIDLPIDTLKRRTH